MTRFIYVFIENKEVKCYPNLKQLCDRHDKVSYFKAFRALQGHYLFEGDGFLVAKDEMHYKTRRRFKTGNDE
jgi:hypothetical protein